MSRDFICICCPVGCRLTVESDVQGRIHVDGNRCSSGDAYGREEILDPKRTVTAVVRSNSLAVPYVPVRTDRPLAKGLIRELLGELYGLHVRVPVKVGDILVFNYRDSGVNVVFSRSVAE